MRRKLTPAITTPDPDLDRIERLPNLVTRVERQLRAALAAGRFAHGRLPTELELAEELGVSRETVRRATNTLTAEGLLVKYRRKGTFLKEPASAPAASPPVSRLLAFVQADYRLPDGSVEPTHRYIARLLLEGALDAAQHYDYDLLVQRGTTSELLPRITRLVRGQSLAGVVFASLGEEKLVRRLSGHGLPMVLVDHDATLAGVSTLRDDSVAGARLAIEHLAQLGHRRIAIAYWKATDLNPWRLQGYRQALQALGLPRRRTWEIMTDLGPHGAREFVARWQELSPRPTAIYCFNNSLALQIIPELNKLGLSVPGDLSLVGGGGEESLMLTHHQCDWHALGQQAVELLIAALTPSTAGKVEHRQAKHELHLGETTAPIRSLD